jgi:hypothetical protein|tara:strand:- start:962 stop:1111 length:150 start_codon:yes stop_codon:yes gene_type:complete
MIKGILLGAILVVGLVGYGVIDTNQVEASGDRVKNGVNFLAKKIDEVTR